MTWDLNSGLICGRSLRFVLASSNRSVLLRVRFRGCVLISFVDTFFVKLRCCFGEFLVQFREKARNGELDPCHPDGERDQKENQKPTLFHSQYQYCQRRFACFIAENDSRPETSSRGKGPIPLTRSAIQRTVDINGSKFFSVRQQDAHRGNCRDPEYRKFSSLFFQYRIRLV